MLTLSIDTSCSTAGVALTENGIVISEIYINNKNTHSVKLMPAIDMIFKNAGREVSELDMIAVVNGPGSYTGLRIGVATAKAISYSADIPVCGVNTLDYLAKSCDGIGEGYVCSVIDARNTHMYFCLYEIKKENNRSVMRRLVDYSAMPAVEMCDFIKSKISGDIIFIGDGVIANREILKNEMADRYFEADASMMLGRVAGAAGIAEGLPKNNADELDVYYLRTPRISTPKKNNSI